MNLGKIVAILLTAFAAIFGVRTLSAEETGSDYIRVWRGFSKHGLAAEKLRQGVEKKLVPATQALFDNHPGLGKAYFPVMLPKKNKYGRPREAALIVYTSQEQYDFVRANTADGKAYGPLHWEAGFQQAGLKTKSAAAVPFAGQVALDMPYDVLGTRNSWGEGPASFFMADIKGGTTLAQMADHVKQVKEGFGPQGLKGYVTVFDGNGYVTAWQNWASQEKMFNAYESAAGRSISQNTAKVFRTLHFAGADPFKGVLNFGQLARILPRPR